jgi:DNA-directed RNA polymerase specialized sigma24 family protein
VTDPEDAVELRPLLFSIAYRMLGSVADAEDIVLGGLSALPRLRQAWPRGRLAAGAADRHHHPIGDRSAPLCARAARDLHRALAAGAAAHLHRARCCGGAVMSDSLSMAFLVLLETLSPVERAVFLLREVFAYDYDDIARIVGKSEANCRQLLARARRHVDDGRRRFATDSAQRAELAERFFDAAEHGVLGPLVELLADDVAFYGDGGSTGRGVRQPMFGRERVQRVVDGIFRAYSSIGARFERREVNGGPGLLAFDTEGGLINVLTVDVEGDSICTVRSVINPEKLGHLGLPLSQLAQRGRPWVS